MSGQWHYSEEGAQYGPVGEVEIIRLIQEGEIPPGAPVCAEGGDEWRAAREYDCFQVEIYPKKKRPPVQAAAVTDSKPASEGASQSPRQTTSPVAAMSGRLEEESNQALQQSVKELKAELKPSITVCVVYSIVWFFLLMVFPILMTFIIPKFKAIFTDMLGPGERLPEFTELVLAISDAIKNNALITLPLGLLLCLGFAYFMGFQIRFLEKNLCRIINALSIVLYLVFSLGVIIAMFLPLIKMMDKLGQ